MGIIIFWIHYIIAAILLYHLLRCIYVKGEVDKSLYRAEYYKTENDKRLKHPIWIILIYITIFLIPILNIFLLAMCIAQKLYCDCEEDGDPYYCKSVFTKEI